MNSTRSATRKYQLISAGCLIGYITVLQLARRYHPTGVPAVLAAIIFALCLAGMMLALAFTLSSKRDEFQRKLLTQALLWSIVTTLTFTVIWGALEELVQIPPIHALIILPFFICVTAAAKVILFRHNRPGNE